MLVAPFAALLSAGVYVAMPASAAIGSPLVSSSSQRCLDVVGGASTQGAAVGIFDCGSTPSQGWVFTGAGELRTFNEAVCLDAPINAAAGAAPVIWPCNNGQNQKFRQNANGSITAVQTGLCLDVNGGATASGTRVILWNCNGQANQRWSGTGGTPPTTPPTTPPSGGTCNVAPVDPQATQQARNLLCYLYSQYGNHILSGQQESTWIDGPDYEMNYIFRNTGKYPAIRGLDMGDSPTFGARAAAWWRAGGIPMVGYHMGSPAQDSDGYAGSQMNANIDAALTAGTADNRRLLQRLDGVSAQLKVVGDAGGAVLWRPYHEAGGTWFWWSKQGGAAYNRLWQFTFNYMTRTKGVHNLVWLHPYNGAPQSSFYPGKQFIDVGGADTYAGDRGPLTSLYNSTRTVVGGTVPIALHENGRIPDPNQLQSSGAKWVLFNTWHSSFIEPSTNPISVFQQVYGHSYVITRDELPNLK